MEKKHKKPIIKGEAELIDEQGNVIGHATVAYYNPEYQPWTDLPESDGTTHTIFHEVID